VTFDSTIAYASCSADTNRINWNQHCRKSPGKKPVDGKPHKKNSNNINNIYDPE